MDGGVRGRVIDSRRSSSEEILLIEAADEDRDKDTHEILLKIYY